MGFPIRISTDQRLFAPSRSLSQRTTSFIASCRQGIHQMPLGHLIALISNAHLPLPLCSASEKAARPDRGLGQMRHCRKTRILSRQTQLELRLQARRPLRATRTDVQRLRRISSSRW